MNKAELSTQVAKQNNITKQDAIALVDSVFEIIEQALIANDKLTISGFGSLDTVTTNERLGRNPRTGEQVKIASKRKIRWAISGVLKKKLNERNK
jgi:nucleoid DNA-binding protein